MKHIRQHLADKQREFATHTFFTRLEHDDGQFKQAMAFAPGLAFWVFAFQDILRLNESRVRDPELRRVANHHRAEDSGHELWYLEDLAELDPKPREFSWAFGRLQAPMRDAVYALVSEVFRTDDDHVRIALLLTLESAGHVFFERIAEYVERNGATATLRYFSHGHLAVEKDHELFEAEMMKVLTVDLTPSVRAEAIAMVDRCYEAFSQMFDALETRLVRLATAGGSVPPVPLMASGDRTNR